MNTCPHCQAPARKDWPAEYLCGSQRRKGEVVRFWRCYQSEIDRLRERVAKLTYSGQRAVDYCDGKHAMLNEVFEGWRKATE